MPTCVLLQGTDGKPQQDKAQDIAVSKRPKHVTAINLQPHQYSRSPAEGNTNCKHQALKAIAPAINKAKGIQQSPWRRRQQGTKVLYSVEIAMAEPLNTWLQTKTETLHKYSRVT